jgi:outer membrane protein OmpA-like peptidoglycan-associated protein
MLDTFGGNDDVLAVTQLQESLGALGYPDVAVPSGVFDEHTERALRDFQRDTGLIETGTVDDQTWGALRASAVPTTVTAKQAEPPPFTSGQAEHPEPRHYVFAGFAFNSADLRSEFDALLDELATDLYYVYFADVAYIVGHTSTSGPDDANKALSERRANAIRDALVARGVPAERLQPWGEGREQPRLPEDQGPTLVAGNRRVEVWIIETAASAPIAPTPADPTPVDPTPTPTDPTVPTPDGGTPDGGTPIDWPRRRPVGDIVDPGRHPDVPERVRTIVLRLPGWVRDALEFDFDDGELYYENVSLTVITWLAAGVAVLGAVVLPEAVISALAPLLSELQALRTALQELVPDTPIPDPGPPHDAGTPPPAGVPEEPPPDAGVPDAPPDGGQPAGRRALHGYQGAKAEAILGILSNGVLVPRNGEIWLNVGDHRRSYMHSGQTGRDATYVMELVVRFDPATVVEERKSTPGVPQTVSLHTEQPLETEIVKVHRRRREDPTDPESDFVEDQLAPGDIEAALRP